MSYFGTVPPIVLASQSPRRKDLFEALHIPFVQIPSCVDEIRRPGEPAAAFARRAAYEKGEDVRQKLAARGETPWVVSADTVVVLDEEVFFKPKDDADARAMTRRLAGRTHLVITGWSVTRTGGPERVEHTETRVTFHPLTEAEIDRYVCTGEGRDKAGAYAIQGFGTFLVSRIEGDYFNVVGLPVSLVVRALVDVGALPEYPP